jgi:hypothetical protein
MLSPRGAGGKLALNEAQLGKDKLESEANVMMSLNAKCPVTGVDELALSLILIPMTEAEWPLRSETSGRANR